MWRTIIAAWHYGDKVIYGAKGVIKEAVLGKRKRRAVLDTRKSLHLFNTEKSQDNLFRVDLYPYFRRFAGLQIDSFDFWRHSLIVGASGSGKSKLLSQIIKQINKKYPDKYHVLVLDPHANLQNDIGGLPNTKVFDFENESINLYNLDNSLMAVEMMVLLFSDLLNDQYNPKLERVLRHTTALLLENNQFSFDNFKQTLLDVAFRNELLKKCSQKSTINFFLTDFTELKTRYYNDAVAPLITFFDEINSLETQGSPTQLQDAINYSQLSIISLDSAKMGNRLVKIAANLILQQVYLLAVSRKIENLILVVDEVAMIESPIVAKMLSELRKFGVTIVLCEQFLNQVSYATKNAIFANTTNYFAFRLSADDAALLDVPLGMKCIENDSATLHQGVLTALSDRKCIVRVMSCGKIIPGFAAETTSFAPVPYRPPTKAANNVNSEVQSNACIVPLVIDNNNLQEIMARNSTSRRRLP